MEVRVHYWVLDLDVQRAYLYTVGILVNVEWCIRKPCSSIILHNITSIAYNHHTHIRPQTLYYPHNRYIDLPDGVVSIGNAAQNYQEPGWGDTFDVEVDLEEGLFRVKRSDCEGGWGQELELTGTLKAEATREAGGYDGDY